MRTILLLHCLILQTGLAFAHNHARSMADSLICPAQMVVPCEQFNPDLLVYGQATVASGTCLDTMLSIAPDFAQFDSVCSRGTITRRFQAIYCDGSTEACAQTIAVNHVQNFFIKFPDDIFADFCDGTGNYGMPIVFGDDCEMVEISYTDQIVDPAPFVSCILIFRDWTVINWCTYNPMQGLSHVPNPNPSAITGNPNNFIGPIVSACGTAQPWASTVVKVSPVDPNPTDYCTFWSTNANGYRYTQSIKVFDYIGPIFSDCPGSTLTLSDTTDNNPEYWNLDVLGLDLAETATDLNTTLTDVCTGSNSTAPYLLYLDLNADGVWETVIDSRNPPPAGMLRYDNADSPGYLGGTLIEFDNRPVPMDQKWRFSIQRTSFGTQATMALRWNTAESPTTFVVPELPNGRHKILWYGEDGCGNSSLCEQRFNLGDTSLVNTVSPPGQGFALYQNEPNPFRNNTTIRFELPEFCTVTLTVFDTEGRKIHRQTADFGHGMQSISLERETLGASGVLFYQLEAGANVAWRKMVLLH